MSETCMKGFCINSPSHQINFWQKKTYTKKFIDFKLFFHSRHKLVLENKISLSSSLMSWIDRGISIQEIKPVATNSLFLSKFRILHIPPIFGITNLRPIPLKSYQYQLSIYDQKWKIGHPFVRFFRNKNLIMLSVLNA